MSQEAVAEQSSNEDVKPRLLTPDWFKAKYQDLLSLLGSRAFQRQLMWAAGSILMAILVATVLMIVAGYNAFLAWIALIRSAIVRFDRTLLEATPLIFTGLSVGLAFKCGLFNIGPEGQLYVGSMLAAIVGYMIAMPIVIHPIVCILVAALAGFAWGFLPGLLKAYRGAHEVVVTMMMSYIAINLTSWLVRGPFKEPGQMVDQTPDILFSAELPKLFSAELNAGFLIAILVVFVVDLFINKTVIGFEMRAVGLNQDAAEYSGINAKRNMALALGIAGMLAGVGGAIEIMGWLHRFESGWSKGYGWDGITVAVLGNNNPWGILFGAILFGALRTGGRAMQLRGVAPAEVISVVQGLVVLFIAAPRIIEWLYNRFTDEARRAKKSPVEAAPYFASIAVSLVGSVMGLAAITSVMGEALLLVLSVVGGILGLYAFVELLARDARGLKALLLESAMWFALAVGGFLMGYPEFLATFAALGVIGVVIAVAAWKMTKMDKESNLGGEN
jgi:simple sugar transport system permease protein